MSQEMEIYKEQLFDIYQKHMKRLMELHDETKILELRHRVAEFIVMLDEKSVAYHEPSCLDLSDEVQTKAKSLENDALKLKDLGIIHAKEQLEKLIIDLYNACEADYNDLLRKTQTPPWLIESLRNHLEVVSKARIRFMKEHTNFTNNGMTHY